MIEPRPYRDARAAADAAAELRAEVHAGRLDGDAVEAVLVAAGHRRRAKAQGPAGLTEREIDVLRLLSLGKSSREIAAALVISPKTARNHIEHIYAKTGATSRVTASMFALRQGLLEPGAA
jgi:DNA-binding CsgD family transcriptional regulator